jgi:hypothetical protein
VLTLSPALVVSGWTTTTVNQERSRTTRHGEVRLCQAIPVVSIAPRLRWRGVDAPAVARLRLTGPGLRPHVRRVSLRRTRGSAAPSLTPRDVGLRHEAFEAGTYRLQVRLRGRTVARGSLRFVGAGGC